MTRTHSFIGDLLDVPRAEPRFDFHIGDALRDAIVHATDRARPLGDDELLLQLDWERGIMDLLLTRLFDGGLFRGGERETFEAFYRMTDDTREYAVARAAETQNLALRCHHLAYARAAGKQSGRVWRDLSKSLAEAMLAYCEDTIARLPANDSGAAVCDVERVLDQMATLFANRSLFTDDDRKRVIRSILGMAQRLRVHSWALDGHLTEHRWPFEFVGRLIKFDASLIDLDSRTRALALVEEAHEAYRTDPFADSFTISTARVAGDLRSHFGEPNTEARVIERTLEALENKAQVFADAGSGLAAATILQDAAKIAERGGKHLPKPRGEMTQHYRDQIERNLQRATSAGEFARVTVTVNVKELDFTGPDAAATVANLRDFADSLFQGPQEKAVEQGNSHDDSDSPDGEQTLLDAIPVLVTDGVKIVKDTDAPARIAAHRLVAEEARRATLGGAVVGEVLSRASQTQALTVELLVSALENAPILPTQRVPLRRAVERFIASDTISAVHILVPLVESGVRGALRHAGIETRKFETHPSGDSFTDEITLGGLLQRTNPEIVAQIDAVLGGGFRRILISSLTDRGGPNLRNKVAHGLASGEDCSRDCAGLLIAVLAKLAQIGEAQTKPDEGSGEMSEVV